MKCAVGTFVQNNCLMSCLGIYWGWCDGGELYLVRVDYFVGISDRTGIFIYMGCWGQRSSILDSRCRGCVGRGLGIHRNLLKMGSLMLDYYSGICDPLISTWEAGRLLTLGWEFPEFHHGINAHVQLSPSWKGLGSSSIGHQTGLLPTKNKSDSGWPHCISFLKVIFLPLLSLAKLRLLPIHQGTPLSVWVSQCSSSFAAT